MEGTPVEAKPRYRLRTLDDGKSRETLQLEVELPGEGRGCAPPPPLPPPERRRRCAPCNRPRTGKCSLPRLPAHGAGVADSSCIKFSIEGDRLLRVHVPGRYRAVSPTAAA